MLLFISEVPIEILDSPRANRYRLRSLELAKQHGGYHFGGSLSAADLLVDLYFDIMSPDDKFILSKGHGCWVYYAILESIGFHPAMEGHPRRDPQNGVYCTTGSMGHGLPTGLGIAYAMKTRGSSGSLNMMCLILNGFDKTAID